MKISIHLTATIHNGTIRINEMEAWEAFKQREIPLEVSVFIQPIEAYRSEKSNNLFNALCAEFCKAQGLDKIYYRNYFKLKYGVSYSILDNGLDNIPKRPGGFFENENRELYWLISTNDYTQVEMNELVKGTIDDCIEAGLSEEIQTYLKEWHE